jgi:hypothetical protein
MSFGLSLAFPFLFYVMVLAIEFLLHFFWFVLLYIYWNPMKKCSWSADSKAWPAKGIDGPLVVLHVSTGSECP